MNKSTRRGFFGLMASLPFAAKAIAQTPAPVIPPPAAMPPMPSGNWMEKSFDYVRTHGISVSKMRYDFVADEFIFKTEEPEELFVSDEALRSVLR